MKLAGCVVLLILISQSAGLDEEEIPNSLFKRGNFGKRYPSLNPDEDLLESFLSGARRHASRDDAESDQASTDVKNPIRIAIFNAGSYSAHLTVNYVLGDKQYEDQLRSNIRPGQHRSIFVPSKATFLRVRVDQVNSDQDATIIDEQITDLSNSTGFCYLLAHTRSYPVYGQCASTYENMLGAWGISK